MSGAYSWRLVFWSIDEQMAHRRANCEKYDHIYQSEEATNSGDRSEICVGADYGIDGINRCFSEPDQEKHETTSMLINYPAAQSHAKASLSTHTRPAREHLPS
jgi:hypothetical protein